MVEQIGAIIERGPEDWQIVQQDEDGNGRIELGGKWKFETPGNRWRCGWCGRIRGWPLPPGWTGGRRRQGMTAPGTAVLGRHPRGRAISPGNAAAHGGESGRGMVASGRYAPLPGGG